MQQIPTAELADNHMTQPQTMAPQLDEQPQPTSTWSRQRMWPAMGWWKHLLVCVALLGVVFAAYNNSFQSGMVLDNKYIIEEYYKALLRADQGHDLLSWKQIGLIFQNDYWWPKGISGLYRPITTFTYWLDYAVLTGKPTYKTSHGKQILDQDGKPQKMSWYEYAYTPNRQLDTTSYHWINLFLHWINAVLVYFVALVVLRRLWPALFVAALFAAHPITTESVTNIIGRADMFAALATFGGLLLYIRGTRSRGSWALPWVIGSALLFTFGVFSKESAAAIPFIFIVYDITYRWRFGNEELKGFPPLLWHGLLYLAMVAGLIGFPLLSSFLSSHLHAFAALPMRWKWTISISAVVIGLVPYLATLTLDRAMRAATLAGVAICVMVSAWFTPWYPLAVSAIVAAVELFRGTLTSESPRYRVTAHAALYLPLYFLLVALPIASLWLFRYEGWDSWDAFGYIPLTQQTQEVEAASAHDASAATIRNSINHLRDDFHFYAFIDYLGRPIRWLHWQSYEGWAERYICASIAVLLGLGLHLSTASPRLRAWLNCAFKTIRLTHRDLLQIPTPRLTRALALLGVALAAVVASFFSYWLGILLALSVALHEVILGTLTARGDDQYRRDWHMIWNGFALGYLAILPSLIALFTVRAWVFANSSPAETPFLDNPIRGIWQVRSLGLPSFEAELAKKPMYGMSFIECKMTAVKIMGKLLGLLTWPVHLCSDYSYDQIPNFSWRFVHGLADWAAILALLVLAGIFIVIPIFAYRRNKALFFFILFFFFAAFPTSNFVITIGSVMAERFMYLPLAGFTGALVIGVFWAMHKLWKKLDKPALQKFITAQGAAVALLSGIVVLYAGRAWIRNFDWHSDITLWESAIKQAPRSFRCYQSLAFAYYEQNAKANIDKMIGTAEGALPIVDPLPDHLNSSRLYLHLGMYYSIKAELNCQPMPDGSLKVTDEARKWYQKAIEVLQRGSEIDRAFNEVNKAKELQRGTDPSKISDAGLGPVYGTLGMAYMRLGMLDKAYRTFQYERQLEPTELDSYIKIATCQIQQQKFDDAAVSLVEVILMDHTRHEAWQLLWQLYGNLPDQGTGPAILQQNGQVRLNINHPVVREHLILAYRDFIRIFRRAHREQAAQDARKAALQIYHFPRERFDPLFDEPIPTVTPDGFIYPE